MKKNILQILFSVVLTVAFALPVLADQQGEKAGCPKCVKAAQTTCDKCLKASKDAKGCAKCAKLKGADAKAGQGCDKCAKAAKSPCCAKKAEGQGANKPCCDQTKAL